MNIKDLKYIEKRDVYVAGLVKTILGQSALIGELMNEIKKMKQGGK